MSIWTLIKWMPTILSLWNRMGSTPLNELTMWGGLVAELVTVIARASGAEVPAIVDAAAIGGAAGAVAHKTAVAKEKGLDEEWKRRVFEPKD